MKAIRSCFGVMAVGLITWSAAGLAGLAQTAEKAGLQNGVLLDNTFATQEGGWMAFGSQGAVRLTPDAARNQTGKPALAFDYTIVPGQLSAAVLPVAAGSLAQLKQLRFWLKTDSATSVAVILSEKKPGGGNYGAMFWSPQNSWQQISLTPDDFALNEGPNDPKDSDGKLDLDQIEGIGIIDLGQLFAGLAGNADFPVVVDARRGPHTLFVDGLQALSEPAGGAPVEAGRSTPTVVIEDFRRPFLNWLTLGGMDLSLSASGNPLARRALEAQYEQADGKVVVLAHPLGQLSLSGTSGVTFEIASAQDAQIAVSLEKRKAGAQQGPRYSSMITIAGGSKSVHESLPFSEFTLDDNGPADPEGKLVPGEIKTISLVDITGAISHERQKNTLWIADLRASVQGDDAAGGKPNAAPARGMAAESPDMGGMVMSHDDPSHVTETMSHHMRMGPHMQMTDLRPANPEESRRADEIIKTLRASIEKYKDYHVALTDGFQIYLPDLPQHEYHFTNYQNALQARFKFDPAHPTSLLYKKTADGYALAGAMYTAPLRASLDELNARVPLSVARWHLHVNICEPPGGMNGRANFMKFGPSGSITTEAECTAAGGKFVPHLFGWMVHVYPFEQDPEEVWAH